MAQKHKWQKNTPEHKAAVGTRRSRMRRRKLEGLSEAQGHRCAYCCAKTFLGFELPKKSMRDRRATLEHLIPQCEPVQTNKDENLVMACAKCNILRAGDDPLTFYNKIRRFKKPNPPRVKKLSLEKLDKQKVKQERLFGMCLIIVSTWPEGAADIADNWKPRVPLKFYKNKRPNQINEIARQVTADSRRMAA